MLWCNMSLTILRISELLLVLLSGGETAEMPGMYKGCDYDVAGMMAGITSDSSVHCNNKISQQKDVQPGDVVVALKSCDCALNQSDFVLLESILQHYGIDLHELAGFHGWKSLGKLKIYVCRPTNGDYP